MIDKMHEEKPELIIPESNEVSHEEDGDQH